MIARVARRLAAAASILIAAPAAARAQGSMTISGHITESGRPASNVSVAISALGLSTTTNSTGLYTFIVSSANVRGQTVTITARRGRATTQSAQIAIVGGNLVQDFDLSVAAVTPPPGTVRDTTGG